MNERSITLKENPRRTVALLPPRGHLARALVVKRYHHPGRLARLFDGARARQELRLLRTLSARAVPVPRPIGLRFASGAWELVTEYVEASVSFEDILRGRAPAPAPPEVLAREIGETLACAHAAGLDHPDLHPGNILVQPDGRSWIVDLRGGKVHSRAQASACRRGLIALASATREHVGPRIRARFLAAYLRALPLLSAGRWAAELPFGAQLARELEEGSRIHRREAVRRASLRWTRLSSVCRPLVDDQETGFSGFQSVEVDEAGARSLWAHLCDPASDTFPLPWKEGERALVLRDLPWRALLRCWYSAARLCEHAIPSARPLALVREPLRCAVFALPSSTGWSAPPPSDAELSSALARIRRSLRDRGLALEGPLADRLFFDAERRCWIGPLVEARLKDHDG